MNAKRSAETLLRIQPMRLLFALFLLLAAGPAQALQWGNWQVTCTDVGQARYSAVLWDIPWLQSWEDTCENTAATINGTRYARPSRCVNTGSNIWGEFIVPDASCTPTWGDFQRQCAAPGVARASAVLWDIPAGLPWEQTCRSTSATIDGQYHAAPDNCVNTGSNVWGEFLVPDATCQPHWGDFQDDGCVEGSGFSGLRQKSAILWDIPAGYSWEDACSEMAAEFDGVLHARPAVCVASDFSWLGDITAVITGAAAGLVTANPAAGAAIGIAVDTAFLAAGEASGGFGAMNMWGVFYVPDSACGEVGVVLPPHGGIDPSDEPLPDLSGEAALCQRMIGAQSNAVLRRAHRRYTRCLDDQALGRTCKVRAYEKSISRVVQEATDAIDAACTEADYAELGFDTGAARPRIPEAALGHVQTLIRQTYPLSYEGKPRP